MSGIFWILLGSLQILMVITAIAGVWNIIVGITRLRSAPRIRMGAADVPERFEGMAGYIVIGVVNLVFGAVLGVILVGVDLFVRDRILKNRHLFVTAAQPEGPGSVPARPQGLSAGADPAQA